MIIGGIMRVKILVGFLLVTIFAVNLMASSQELTVEGKKYVRSANMHVKDGRFEKAMPLYELVLEENPNHIEAMEKIAGILYDKEANYKKADIYYQRILVEIDNIFAEYEEILKTDEKAAKKFYKKNIKKTKLDEEKKITTLKKLRSSCWVKMFKEAQNETDDTIALENFLYIYSIAPDSIKTVKMLAFKYSTIGDEPKTLEYLIKAAEMNSADDMVRTQIGNTYFDNGNYEDAVIWYQSAADVNVENVDNFFNLAIAYDKLKNDEKSIENFEKVIAIDPVNLNAIVNLSNKYAKIGDINKSLELLKKAIELDPENLDYVSFLCTKLSIEKRFEEFLEYADKWKALESDPKNLQDIEQLINYVKQQLK
jgi:tetratricopeptide (TPR) repeat protein